MIPSLAFVLFLACGLQAKPAYNIGSNGDGYHSSMTRPVYVLGSHSRSDSTRSSSYSPPHRRSSSSSGGSYSKPSYSGGSNRPSYQTEEVPNYIGDRPNYPNSYEKPNYRSSYENPTYVGDKSSYHNSDNRPTYRSSYETPSYQKPIYVVPSHKVSESSSSSEETYQQPGHNFGILDQLSGVVGTLAQAGNVAHDIGEHFVGTAVGAAHGIGSKLTDKFNFIRDKLNFMGSNNYEQDSSSSGDGNGGTSISHSISISTEGGYRSSSGDNYGNGMYAGDRYGNGDSHSHGDRYTGNNRHSSSGHYNNHGNNHNHNSYEVNHMLSALKDAQYNKHQLINTITNIYNKLKDKDNGYNNYNNRGSSSSGSNQYNNYNNDYNRPSHHRHSDTSSDEDNGGFFGKLPFLGGGGTGFSYGTMPHWRNGDVEAELPPAEDVEETTTE